jgi:hypothetical protein
MSNLGDSNTPIEGQSFGLPAGAELDEDTNGNLVVRDSTGTVVLTRDEAAGEWQFGGSDITGINSINANGDLTGINSLDATSVTMDNGTIATESTTSDAIVRFSQLSDTESIVTVQSYDDLPDPTTLTGPVIYRVTDADDYAVPTTA